MPIVIGLGQDDWKDPLNLYGGKAPEPPKVDTSTASSRVSSANQSQFSDSDRSALVDTIIAEAGGEGTDGMKAVAAVIKNRADRRGKSPLDIIKEPDQFTGYSKPGEGALKAMKDPVIRQEAENVLNGMFSGSIADPTGGADHYHADYVNPSWASKMQETAKIGRHLFYTSGQDKPKAPSTQTAFAPGLGTDQDKESPFKAVMTPQSDTSWLRYANKDATRSQPLAPKLVGALSFLPELGLTMEVFSGGQPTSAEGGARTGSERHDHGGAADVFFYKDGRRLDWENPQDVPVFQEIVRRGKENGVTGFGAGDGYMRPGSMHIGFGKSAVWGAGGKGKNAPEWLRSAYAAEAPSGTTMADTAPKGLVSPGNIDLTKRPVVKNDDGSISTVRSMSFEENGKEILVPTVSPDGRLLSEADAIDLYHKTGKHLGVFDNANDATSYAQNLHAQQEKLYAKASATGATKPIVVDSNFKPQDPMGLFGAQNPFNVGTSGQTVDPAQQQEQASAQAEQNRMNAYNEQHNETVGRQQQLLEANDPGRYTTVSEDELNNWTQQWKKDNQSSGMAGDIYRMGKSGTANLARSADNLSRMLLNQIPGAGPAINGINDAIDKWVFGGKTRGEMLQRVAEKADASVSDEQLAADNKRWTQTIDYKDAQGNDRQTVRMGDAWRDPRSYLGMAVRSAPETIATMAPAGLMARGAYTTAIAAGMAEREAAAASAKTATLAGSAFEGVFGGSDSALNVRDQIAKLPPEILQSSAAYKSAIAGGMTPEQAIKNISDNAETQAFILSGVATGMFGGMGDRMLAKILAEGVTGGVVKRSVTGAVKGIVSEGVLEEAPQSALSQVAENKAMQTADPRVKLSDNVVEQTVGGLVGGGVMGSAFGGVGGAASRAEEHTPAQPAPGAAPSPIIPPAPAPKGPLGRAVQHAEQQTAQRTQRDASEAVAGMPVKGATVRVDHEGVEPFMGRVEGHEGDEIVVFDSQSGEVYQVPRSSVTQIADSPENIQAGMPKDTGPRPIDDTLPEFSNDPALEPAAPIASQTTSEQIPERSGTMPALDRIQGRPQPGQRVIVDDGKSNRFSARIQSYEEGRTEALVKNDAGEDLQVPVSTLHVDKSTPKQIEAEELKRNPPVERELGDAGPNSRKTFGKTVVFPDEDHAALYDLAKDREIAKKLGGAAYSDLDRVSSDEVSRLAAKFKVEPQDLISMADDYRYRADTAGREARSTLPVNMHGVNSRLLRQAQNKLAKATGAEAAPADDLSNWWDVELTQVGRRNVLEAAGVKRPDKVMWEHLTPKIREKLAAFRVTDEGEPSADSVAPIADTVDTSADTVAKTADTVDTTSEKSSTFRTAKGSTYVVHEDGTTTRDKAERSDPGHEGDKGVKKRSARTVYLDTNAGALSAAGLNGLGSKGARVAIKDGKATLVTWRDHDNSWGASEGSRDIPFTDKPTVGAYPLELWNKADDVPGHEAYSGMHAGNKIVSVGSSTADNTLDDEMAAAAKSDIDEAAHEAATSPKNDRPEPTQAQKEAGNYKVGKISLGGLNISIENPEGSARKGVDASGNAWSVKMQSHYGYILGTVGKDKDHIDVFVKPGTAALDDSSPVFVIDQRSANGKLDEHKVMLGFATEVEARKAYMVNYTKGWRGLGDITETTLGSFKGWLAEGNTSKPFAPKWFTTSEKAEAYIAKNGMQATHQVEERNRRFEIQPVEQHEVPMPEFEHEDGDPDAFRRASDQGAARDAVYKRFATRMMPKEFVQHVSTQGKNSQEAALIDKEGRLLVIKPTANTNGDHAGIMEELYHAGVEPETYSPWMRLTAYGAEIGVSGNATPASLRTLNALKSAAEREGVKYLREAEDTEKARKEIENKAPDAEAPKDGEALAKVADAIREIVAGNEEGVAYGLRPDLTAFGGSADVHFVFGNAKAGLAHIGAKRSPEVLGRVLKAVALGTELQFVPAKKTVRIIHDGVTAVLSLDEHGKNKSWLLTGWENGRPDAKGEVGTQSPATQTAPTFSRDDLVAGLDTIVPSADTESKVEEEGVEGASFSPPLDAGSSARADTATAEPLDAIASQGTGTAEIIAPKTGNVEVPAARPKAKLPKLVDRLENYFRPGRRIPSYGGTDEVISFNRLGDGKWDVTVAEVKSDGSLERPRNHATAPDDRDLKKWEKTNPVGEFSGKAPSAELPNLTTAPEPGQAADTSKQFANNKMFTADAVEAARARLKAKMSQLNSGIDPEMMMDGMTIAGAYIESGVRDFADYAKRMSADFGDGIKPYLLAFWEGARNWPNIDTTGMTSSEDSKRQHAALITELPASEAEALGAELKAPKKAPRKGRSEDRVLEGDYGVEHIDGYGDSYDRESGNSVKDAFLKDASGYLKAASDKLVSLGYVPVSDKKGRPMKAVSVNQAGDAVSGEASLHMINPDTGVYVYANVQGGSLRNAVPTSPSGIYTLFRASTETYGSGFRKGSSGNLFAPLGITAGQLADLLHKAAGGVLVQEDFVRQHLPDPSKKENGNELAKLDQGRSDALAGVPAQAVPDPSGSRSSGQGSDERGRADPDRGERVGNGGDLFGGSLSTGAGKLSVPASGGNPAAAQRGTVASDDAGSAQRRADDNSSVNEPTFERHEDVKSAAVPAQNLPVDYTITDADELGAGGQKAKYKANVDAIRVLRTLTDEKRPATRQEQTALAKWVGWGGLQAAFTRDDGTVAKGWEKEAAELTQLLTPEEYKAAQSSARNAHYTSPEIVNAVWQIARRLGFKGGQVLEPSVGAGNFLGLMPGDVKGAAQITGVELDHITGSIAKNLYPTANIQAPMGFEKLVVPDDHFDLAIGNPPFGSEKLYDKQRRGLNKLSIHNFFFAKSVAALRPGGVLAMVVTNRFLDGNNAAARELIGKTTDLIGAIRLPNNAFLKNAGTEVTTDIIILRKRMEGDVPNGNWGDVVQWTDAAGKVVPLNQYFVDHPEMMLGDFGGHGSMYGPDEPALIARPGQDLAKDLDRAIKSLPMDIMADPGQMQIETVKVPETVNDVAVGTAFLSPDGKVHVRKADSLGRPQSEAVELDGLPLARVTGMLKVRDAFAKLRRAQIDDKSTNAQVEMLRAQLNRDYDAFVKKHGPINADVNKRLLRDDPTWPQLAALEDGFDKGISKDAAAKTGEQARAPSAKKAAIFSKRTQQPYRRPDSAANAKDALAAVLNERGRIDMQAMSRLYGKSEDDIVSELGALIYKTPNGGYETADAYLSGNVRQKLAEAERAAADDVELRRNVTALRAVIPDDIEAIDIDVKAGSPWIPPEHIADFIRHINQNSSKPEVFYSAANAKWQLRIPSSTAAADAQWATSRVTVSEVINAALNQSALSVTESDGKGGRQVNQEATDAANEKVERVKAEWARWIWQDDTRRDQLARLYNDTFNTDVLRTYDGSHLTLPGKVGDDVITLRPHQKNFIWRTLQTGTALADHVVGAGKTFALIASIMEKRRMGQAKKPMLTVPNHLVGQWAADFIKLYPGAKILAATKKDFETANRKQLFARVATGDWDCVIVAHSSFGKIGVSPEIEMKFIQQQMDDLESSITALRNATGEKGRNAKQLTKWRDSLKAKMEKLLDGGAKDNGLTFDELGVDALYVDEAHEFKNLAYSTSMTRVAGLGNQAGSQKAADLYMKSRMILERTGNNNLVFATGTPISNTMAEMYTVQRYLDEKALRAQGLAHFDAWARVFGEVVTDWELAPSGKYKLNNRFRRFVNIPELLQRYRSFADVITNDDIKAQLAAQGKTLPLPRVKGGKPENVAVERSPDQAKYIGVGKATENGEEEYPQGSLVYRAEHLPKKAEKGADNMLKVMSDARKAALDMRLIDPSYGDYAGSKVHIAADNIKRIFDQWHADKGTQLVFIDLSTPKKAAAKEAAKIRDLVAKAEDGDEKAQEKLDSMSPDEFLALESSFSVYDDLRQKLLDRGIPEDQIAYIHDANTDLQKEELFGKVRSGTVRILFGSTPKMGAGTNVQNRLVALHHLDAPWRPSDLEQRDGRGIRQGNELYAKDPDNFEIEIMRYATKQTLDARQWQGIESKATFIQQIRKGNMKDRTIEDIGGEASNAAEMKAEASGNPLILEENELRRKLKQMQGKATEHDREQHRIKRTIGALEAENSAIEQRLPAMEADAAAAETLIDKPFAVEFRGKTFEKPSDFGADLLSAMRKEITDPSAETPTGSYGDFELGFERTGGKEFTIVIGGAREHHVVVDDVANADSTGTAMRIVNTVKKFIRDPAADKARMAENADQIPKLSSQLEPWGKADELADLAARHRRVLDALKPKANAAANTVTAADPVADAANYDAPKADKRPDPIERSPNNMRQLDHPKLDRSKPIGPQAAELVRAKGMQTGHEHLIAFEDDGSIVEYGTAGQVNATGLSDRLAGAWMNPDRKIVAYHNHPSSTPLSTQDIGNLGYPGLHAVWAIGHNGQDTRAELNQAARDFFAKHDVPHEKRVKMIDRASRAAEARIWAHMLPIARKTKMALTDANNWLTAAVNVAMHQAGIIDFSSNRDYNFSSIDGLDAVMGKATRQAQDIFYGSDRSPSPRRYDRRAVTFRHIADVAGAPAQHQSDAGDGAKPTGLAEAGNRSYSGEEGRAGQIRERALDEIKGKLTDIQPALLKTIPLNYFTELAQSGMTAVGEYLRVKRRMDAYRGDKHAEADKLAQEWLKYTRNGFIGKDRARSQELADLMHDTTIAGIDPSSTEEEERNKGGYAALRKRYMALPEKGKELYNEVRNSYRQQADELDKILLDNVRKAQQIAANRAEERYKQKLAQIKASGLTGLDLKQAEEDAASRHRAETTKSSWAAKARLTKMRIAFESSRVETPYFPLGRFGRYFATLRDLDGTIMSFSKFETAAARDRFARDLRNSSPGMRVDVGVMERGDDIRTAMDPRIVAEIQEILGGAGVDEGVMDQIWQRYLESMPDLSTRKRFIHRKGTEGFNRDALRVFSSHMFHAAHQMARAKYGLELQELVGQAMDQARETEDPTKGVTLANELGARHKWVMNPTGSKAAQVMTSTAFVWYLAASPAAAVVNMTQTPMMGLPILAGRFGSMTKAASALLSASYDSLKGKGSVSNASLAKDEKHALEAFYSSGLIDRTQSHDLAGAGDTGVEYSPMRARVMGLFSVAFHRAEVWNREVTALAAYRMARDAGQDMAQAIDTAHDLTWRAHFDYSNSSRPAILQNDLAKVALVFRQHNINMLYRLFRDMHQSVKGVSPQLRREARYQLAGITGMMALMAGASGTVGFHLAMALAEMIFGDDDDPMDFEQQFRADMVDILGPQLGGVVLDGVPGHYLGIDLSSRIGMPDLWFRSPNRELQGKDEYQYWLSQTLGATTGIGEAIWTGANVALDGDVARGFEMAAPKFARDLMKAYRYYSEGLQSFDGDEILSPDSMGPHDLLAQAMGFNPARVSETWERNNALKGAEHKVVAKRQSLVNAFAMAAISHDEEAIKEALDGIRKFNSVPLHFGVAIKKETLERSLKTRASNRAKREDGVLIRDKILNARLRAELADRINE